MVAFLVVIYIVFISLGLPDSMFGVSWPVVHLDLNVAESFASLYSIITGVCSGGASFVAGKVIRKFGTPMVTFVSILLTAIGLVGISFAPNIVVMMFFAVVMGYGAGAIDTGLNNYVSLHFEARHMSWLHCFWGIGVTVSPLIFSGLLESGSSWRVSYRVVAMLQLAIASLVAVYLKRWRAADRAGTQEETAEAAPGSEKPNVRAMKGLIPSVLSQGVYCAMEFLVGTWGATYLVHTYGTDPAEAARWISLYYGGIMLSRFVSGFLTMRFDDKTMLRLGIGCSFAGMLVLLIPIGPVASVGLLLIGFGFGPIFPSIIHSVPERFGERFSADVTGWHMGGAYALGFSVQLIFGYVATATTFRITPFVLLCAVIVLFLLNETAIRRSRENRR